MHEAEPRGKKVGGLRGVGCIQLSCERKTSVLWLVSYPSRGSSILCQPWTLREPPADHESLFVLSALRDFKDPTSAAALIALEHANALTMATDPNPSSFQTTSWLDPDPAAAPDSAALIEGDAIMPLEDSAASAIDGSAAGQNANNNNRAAVAVACVQCRSRHLKCDGAARCARCVAEGIQCSYVKSRRGWKGPRKSTQRSMTATAGPSIIGMKRFSPVLIK